MIYYKKRKEKKCVRDDGMIHHVLNDDMTYEMMMIYMK